MLMLLQALVVYAHIGRVSAQTAAHEDEALQLMAPPAPDNNASADNHSSSLLPVYAFLRPQELPPGTETPFADMNFCFVGPEMQPLTPDLTDAVRTSVVNAFSLMEYRVSMKINATMSAPVTVVSTAEFARLFPGTMHRPLASIRKANRSRPKANNRRNLLQPSRSDAREVLERSLNAVNVVMRGNVTRDSKVPFASVEATNAFGAVTVSNLLSFGIQARLLAGPLTLLPNGLIFVMRTLREKPLSSQTRFQLDMKVANRPGARNLVPLPTVVQTSVRASVVDNIPRPVYTKCDKVVQSFDTQQAIASFMVVTGHAPGQLQPQAALKTFQSAALEQLSGLGFDPSDIGFNMSYNPEPNLVLQTAGIDVRGVITSSPIPVTNIDTKSQGGLSGGALTGTVVGCVAATVIILAFVGFCIWRRRRCDTEVSPWQQLDTALLGFMISEDQLEFCRDKDGTYCVLGAGAYGRVYKGIKGGVQDVAIKQLLNTETANQSQLEAFMKEVSLLKGLNYDKNIVQFYGVCVPKDSAEPPMLICELMKGGNVAAAIARDDPGLLWTERGHQIALDISKGLAFLHSHQVCHGDIKSQNVLLTEDFSAKIGDVGLARLHTDDTGADVAWTLSYAAPETLLGAPSVLASDIFSFGVLLHELVVNETPWTRGNLPEPRIPQQCPQKVWDLILECTNASPARRPVAKECFERLKAAEVLPDTGHLVHTIQLGVAPANGVANGVPHEPPHDNSCQKWRSDSAEDHASWHRTNAAPPPSAAAAATAPPPPEPLPAHALAPEPPPVAAPAAAAGRGIAVADSTSAAAQFPLFSEGTPTTAHIAETIARLQRLLQQQQRLDMTATSRQRGDLGSSGGSREVADAAARIDAQIRWQTSPTSPSQMSDSSSPVQDSPAAAATSASADSRLPQPLRPPDPSASHSTSQGIRSMALSSNHNTPQAIPTLDQSADSSTSPAISTPDQSAIDSTSLGRSSMTGSVDSSSSAVQQLPPAESNHATNDTVNRTMPPQIVRLRQSQVP